MHLAECAITEPCRHLDVVGFLGASAGDAMQGFKSRVSLRFSTVEGLSLAKRALCVPTAWNASGHASRCSVWLHVQVLLSVFSGQKPALPADMPAQYRALLERCWANKPDARPTFVDIGGQLQRMLSATRQPPPECAPPAPPLLDLLPDSSGAAQPSQSGPPHPALDTASGFT